MSSQTKIIKDIMSTYESILENRNVLEAADVYDNVDFKDYAVGKSSPSKDTINTTLLQDIQTAAKSAGPKWKRDRRLPGNIPAVFCRAPIR